MNNIYGSYIYFVSIVQFSLSSFIILFAWILGGIKVFTWTNSKIFFLPTVVRYVIAGFLAFISLLVVFISLPIGIIEIFRQGGAYIKIKSVEYANKNNENIPLWYKIITNEYTGLVLAYIVIPLHILLLQASTGFLEGYTFPAIGMLFVYLPPTIIRFVLKPQGLQYISEIFVGIVLSVFCSFCLYYVFLSWIYFPTIFDEVSICLVLSYKSERRDNGSKMVSYSLWLLLTMLALLRRTVGLRKPLLEALTSSLIAFLIVFPFIFYLVSKKSNGQFNNETEQLYQLPRQDTRQSVPATADTLIDIGLAHIGRKTAYDNQYLTPELTAERHNIEHTFIQALAQTFTDEKTRSGLSRHFMLYKELTLFIVFNMVLKKDKELHTKIQSKLKEHLSLGLSADTLKKRNDYWRKLSQKFHESYTRTHDMAGTLEYTFWSILPESIKSKGIFGRENLYNIFLYIYNAVEQEYKRYVKQVWGIK